MLLKCHDVEITKSFYKDILDFSVADSDEGTCSVSKGDCSIIFTPQDLWNGYPKCTGTIYFFIDDVVSSKLNDKARKSLMNDLHVGFIDFELYQQRYPRL